MATTTAMLHHGHDGRWFGGSMPLGVDAWESPSGQPGYFIRNQPSRTAPVQHFRPLYST